MQVFGFKANKCKEEVVAKVDLIDSIYPVGSIYMSANNVNPATLFGGTWQKLEGRFLLGAGSGYTLGTTGGEATHKLTENEMPSHNHSISISGYSTQRGVIGEGTGVISDFVNDPVSGNTGAKGGNAAHNNMPPYLAVNMWKRTA